MYLIPIQEELKTLQQDKEKSPKEDLKEKKEKTKETDIGKVMLYDSNKKSGTGLFFANLLIPGMSGMFLDFGSELDEYLPPNVDNPDTEGLRTACALSFILCEVLALCSIPGQEYEKKHTPKEIRESKIFAGSLHAGAMASVGTFCILTPGYGVSCLFGLVAWSCYIPAMLTSPENQDGLMITVGSIMHLLGAIYAPYDAQINNKALQKKYGLAYKFNGKEFQLCYKF